MSIELKEYFGSPIVLNESGNSNSINCKESMTSLGPISENSIMQDIEGLHVGPTRNYTWYTEEALKSCIDSWTTPYNKPLIMHHNENDGKIIGRVLKAELKKANTRSGTPALLFTCNVPDKDGIEQIKDGRLSTVSVGVSANDVRCSICGEPIQLNERGENIGCKHQRGANYNGEICYWNVYDMEAKELSYVIVPSDIYAHNVRTYSPKELLKTGTDIQENINLNPNGREIIDLAEQEKNQTQTVEVKENQTIKEEVKDDKTASEVEVKKEVEKSIIADKDAEIENLKKEIEQLKADKIESDEKLKSISKDLKDATDKIDAMTNELKAETELKEAAENSLLTANQNLREALEDNLNTLRVSCNKSVILKESLESRTIDSIKDSISDLKQEIGLIEKVKEIKPVEDPTLKADIDLKEKNQNINVNESNDSSNINMTESLEDLLRDLLL